jgi:hypothetical protein
LNAAEEIKMGVWCVIICTTCPLSDYVLLCDSVLQSLAGLESGSTGSGDLDLLFRLRVAAGAGGTLPDFKGAEAGKLYFQILDMIIFLS